MLPVSKTHGPLAARRVLMVCTNLKSQGIETHAVHFAGACAEQNVECLIAAQPGGFIDKMARSNGITVVPLKIHAAADLLGLWALFKILRTEKIDVLLGSDAREFVPIALAGWLAGVTTFLFRHVNAPMKRAEVWWLPRMVASFLPVSKFTQNVLVERGVPVESTHVLYSSAEVQPEAQCASWRAAIRSEMKLPANAVVVGFVGNLEPYKGSMLLAEAANQAMAKNPDLHLLWVGPEHLHASVQQALKAEFLPRHRWLGWQLDVRPLYAAVDVLAMPSLCNEAFPRVCIEAQACGTPVLGNRTAGGLPETLADGLTGKLLEPEVAAWTAALLEFAALPAATRSAQRETVRSWVHAHFSPAIVIGQFCQLVTTLGSSHKRLTH